MFKLMVAALCVCGLVGGTSLDGYGTTYEILAPGVPGQAVSVGDTVTVHAQGTVQGGKQFWSTKDAGQQPFTYKAGVGGVITGWDQGCLGMELQEKRLLHIPANEGYGARGFPAWGIPENAGLTFEIELLRIQRKDL